MDGVQTGVFLLTFAQQLRRKNADVLDIYLLYLTLLVYSNSVCESKTLAKSERQMKQRLYKLAGAAYGVCAQVSENEQSTIIKGETIISFADLLHQFYFS